MTEKAANRLDKLKSDIEAQQQTIDGLRKEHTVLLTTGNDGAADKVAAKVREAETALSILKDRLPVLEELTQQEEEEAQAVEAARLTQEANELRAEFKGHFVKAAKLAEQLQKAVSEIEENTDLKWYLVARKAKKLGGCPTNRDIEGISSTCYTLDQAKKRLNSIAQAYSHRVMQVTTER